MRQKPGFVLVFVFVGVDVPGIARHGYERSFRWYLWLTDKWGFRLPVWGETGGCLAH